MGSIAATECNKHYVFGGSIQYDLVINSTRIGHPKWANSVSLSTEKKIRNFKTVHGYKAIEVKEELIVQQSTTILEMKNAHVQPTPPSV